MKMNDCVLIETAFQEMGADHDGRKLLDYLYIEEDLVDPESTP